MIFGCFQVVFGGFWWFFGVFGWFSGQKRPFWGKTTLFEAEMSDFRVLLMYFRGFRRFAVNFGYSKLFSGKLESFVNRVCEYNIFVRCFAFACLSALIFS